MHHDPTTTFLCCYQSNTLKGTFPVCGIYLIDGSKTISITGLDIFLNSKETKIRIPGSGTHITWMLWQINIWELYSMTSGAFSCCVYFMRPFHVVYQPEQTSVVLSRYMCPLAKILFQLVCTHKKQDAQSWRVKCAVHFNLVYFSVLLMSLGIGADI